MRSALWLGLPLLVLSSTHCLQAQDNAAPVPQPPVAAKPHVAAPTGSIHGTVFCGDTHRPARGASIIIQPISKPNANAGIGPQIARTGMDGSYTVEHVPEGEYAVLALLPGYLSPLDDLNSGAFENGDAEQELLKAMAASGTVAVRAHQVASYDLTLARGAIVSGQVLYSDGSPASQATIEVEDIHAKPHETKPGSPEVNIGALMRMMFIHQTSATDDQGHFRISGLKPGTYRIAAVQAPSSADVQNGDEGMGLLIGIADPGALRIYSGDTSSDTMHRNAAKTYELRAGEEVPGIDITLPLDAFHTVRGQLAAKDGRPLNMGDLTLTDASDDTVVFRGKVQSNGSFAFNTVPAGTYTLAATNAFIGKVPEGTLAVMERFVMQPTNAFADGNTTLIVKDVDLPDASLTLAEVPLPKPPSAESTGVVVQQ